MKVYLYCRNSCEHQKLSVEAQIDQLKVYADKQGYDIAGVFIDEAISFFNIHTPYIHGL